MKNETRTETFRVPVENVSHLTLKVDGLNKRARRLNLTPLRIEIVGSETVKRVTSLPPFVKYTSEVKLIEIVGESPVLAGHELIARLTPAEDCEGENFVRTVPGKSCPVEYRTVDMKTCDHCKTRRVRKDTFVLLHTESGKHTVVGRNCISDYLGHASPEALLAGAEFLFEADSFGSESESDYYGSGDRNFEYHSPIELFTAMTAIFIRRFGWTPRSKADERNSATADGVWRHLLPVANKSARRDKEDFARKNNLTVTDDDLEVATKALDWARNNADGNDYIYNLRLACTPETVSRKTIGLVASVISAYNRNVEKLVELHARKIDDANCVHIGEVGVRAVFEGCAVRGTRNFESDYGVTTLVTLSTPAGNIVKWWASGDKTEDFPVGDTVTITGTVKAHDEYKGRKETLVNRCKMGVSGKAKPVVEAADPALAPA